MHTLATLGDRISGGTIAALAVALVLVVACVTYRKPLLRWLRGK